MGDVGVIRPVDQERRRVFGRDPSGRAEGIERPGIGVGIVAGDFPGREAVLAAIEVEA